MRKHLQIKAWILLILFISEIFSPFHLLALSSGPSQPEMAAFTPAGTTEMVDPFTGDFTYNIPLMDVEGYPINIAYNSGVTMEQEASWVGLGWNLNVGTINRSVRGLPDDFKGDLVSTETSMKDMIITKLGYGSTAELLGREKLAISANVGISLIHNNYKGFGLSIENSIGGSAGGPVKMNGSVGFDLNTLDGTSINQSLSASVSTNSRKSGSLSFGGSLGSGYNTRTGQSMLNLGTTAGYNPPFNTYGINPASASFGTSLLPIGMMTYTPYPSIKMETNTVSFSGSIGGEIFGFTPGININGSRTVQKISDNNIQTPAYGYLYSESANDEALKDFNRDKQVQLNKTTTNLSPTNFTYDVFSTTGQGVSGMFRPFRNDIGTMNDPAYEINSSSSNSFGAEAAIGGYFKGGINYSSVELDAEYGPWVVGNEASSHKFLGEVPERDFENVFFKAAGDLSQSDLKDYEAIGKESAIAFTLDGTNAKKSLVTSSGTSLNEITQKSFDTRVSRAKVLSILTASEAKYAALDDITDNEGEFYQGEFSSTSIPRIGGKRKAHHISEITQINPDGEKFVFGIPAYNNSKKEVNYATDSKTPTISEGRIGYSGTEASTSNNANIDSYFSSVETPGYAHSFLLTAKLSNDYQDVTGDGVSPDDIGVAHKFNYQKTSSNYKWRVPYSGVSFMKGFKSNKLDQKASYSYGTKEMWYLHTIESKNQVAEFHISPRKDALGSKGEDGGRPASPYTDNESYKLDYIVLYNKLDRLKNKENATPIKRIDFNYDYSICKGVENHKEAETDGGKLTLKSIEVSYGKSERGKESPYVFTYSAINPVYNPDNSDRWGNFKNKSLNPMNMENNVFPYTLQNQSDSIDLWASAWSLEQIQTPSGGKISVEYEADDYGYVQDKDAMQMFTVVGAGSTTAYSSSTKLYENEYLYIKCPESIDSVASELDPKILSEWFLGKDKRLANMYFKFLTSIGGENDYAPGYTLAREVGYCTGSNPNNYLYVKISEGSPNPISEAAWGYFRQNLFNVLYNQPTVTDTGLESVLRGMVANIADIIGMIIGTEDLLEKREIANNFVSGKSFIRLNNPTKFKKGGGSRVKQILMSDEWQSISGEGENATYGQTYDYTTEDFDGRIISSGVASYEPMIGNDENPFREPVAYVAQESKGHVPAIEAYQEKPFGESFFPTASVGYSKVTVRNIHFDKGKSSKAITEHEFYTARDFPVIVKSTDIKALDRPAGKGSFSFPFLTTRNISTYTASQGYSIILNDMHGKPLSTINYGIEESDTSFVKKKLGGTIYNYRNKNSVDGKLLNNKVKVLTQDGYLKDKLLGVEYDLVIDSRRSYEENASISSKLNVDVTPSPVLIPPVVVLPGPGFNSLKDITETKTIVVTKVVQMYGIIESVQTFTDQYSVTTFNELYDGTTGDVILTKRSDEHLQDSYEYTIPAYSITKQERMGPAYVNLGFKTSVKPLGIDSICNPDTNAYINPGQLKHGDEVLLFSNSGNPQRAWVEIEKPKSEILNTCPDEVSRARMSTAWYDAYGAICADELDIDTSKYLKGERGEILEEAYIFHLKSHHTDSILAISYPTITNGFNQKKHVSSDVARFLLPHKAYTVENQRFCNAFDSVAHRRGDTLPSGFTFGKDLNYEVSGTDSTLVTFFDLTDTIYAEVERVDAVSTSYHYGKACGCYIACEHHFTDYDKRRPIDYEYIKKYNACESSTENYEKFYSPAYSLDDPIFSKDDQVTKVPKDGYEKFQTHLFKANCDTLTYKKLYGPADSLTIYPRRKSLKSTTYSKSVFRIKYDPATDIDLNKYIDSTQLYLIAYKIQLPGGGTDFSYFIEKGRKLHEGERSPFAADKNLNECAYDYSPYGYKVWGTYTDSSSAEPCTINYRLIDGSGEYITGLNQLDTIKVIQSGNRNQLSASSGRIVSTSFPLKLDVDSALIGIKTAADGLEIIQAEGLTFSEGQKIINPYGTVENPFLKGIEGTFRVDSSLRYLSPRYQKSSIESSKDGYMEELPPLWTKAICSNNIFAPSWEQSSGWFLNSSNTKYASNGRAEEARNNLDIYTAQIQNAYGSMEAMASNCAQNNMAYDNFEQYYSFGTTSSQIKPAFRAIDVSGYESSTPLLSMTNLSYELIEYPNSNRLVKGVAHTGNTSLFLRGDSMGQVNVVVTDSLKSLIPLEQVDLADNLIDSAHSETINYSSTATAHFNQFTTNLKSTVAQSISSLKTTGVNKDTITILPGDSNGLFKPDTGEYLLSIWMKELVASGTRYAGTSPEIEIVSSSNSKVLKASGPMIDGWMRIEGTFIYSDQYPLYIILKGGLWGAFYDDLRIHPYASNMNTYVYDRYSNRLKAKLDENNYATFYEYDEEGIPAQVKRETDVGVVTISESRQSQNKHSIQ